MKKKIFVIAALIICLTTIATGTLAYFTAEDHAQNIITSGKVDIDLIETTINEDGTESPFEELIGIMPGTSVSKIVKVTNTGNASAYIRIAVDKEILLAYDSDEAVDLGLISMNYNLGSDADEWTLKEEYYYYNSPLKAGDTTKPLFTEVVFDKTIGNMYQGADTKINVNAYATQVANNGKSALDAAGWPVEE